MTTSTGNLAVAAEDRSLERGWSSRAALTVGDRTYSHREVHEGAARAGSVLTGIGVRRGDAVLLALADGVELAWAFMGAVRVGAIAVPVNPLLPSDDHRYLAKDCRAVAVVCDDDLILHFETCDRVLTSSGLASSLATSDPMPAATVDPTDPAYAQYTSGTTGVPRAAVHRHGDPLVYARAFAEGAVAMTPDDVLLSISKMYFAYGLGNSLFFPLLTGARAVLHPGRPRPQDVADLVAHHRSTVLFAVPTFYANLLSQHSAPSSFRSLRVAVSAGERLTPGVAERTTRLLGCPVLDSLGSTEVGQAFAGGTLRASGTSEEASQTEVRPGTLGRVLPPYEISVRDDAGRDRRAGKVGMLWVRGPTVLLEYLGQPKATSAAFDGEWLCTGDLASIDDDGFLCHHGRADDMEMVGGITVAPHEIEDLLGRHHAVSEVAVVAVTDEAGASRLEAFVVTSPGVTGDEQLAGELRQDVREQLAPFKVPRSVRFVDALPRTPTGKLRRFALRSGGDRSISLGAG